jgi:hypothetical protein
VSKLTLSVDDRVISRAKRYARERGTSISEMVEAYLSSVTSHQVTADTPVLRSLRGSLRKGDPDGYKKHLIAKYR